MSSVASTNFESRGYSPKLQLCTRLMCIVTLSLVTILSIPYYNQAYAYHGHDIGQQTAADSGQIAS